MKSVLAALFGLILISPAHAEEISATALDHLSGDIVVLGEIHDNPTHHLNQARAIAAIKPKAVVFEMLSPAQAAKITPGLLKDEKALEKALGWKQAGWPDFAIYYPIFKALGEARIYGAAEPRDVVRSAMTTPLPEVFGAGAARYGLDHPYPDALQKQLEAEAMADHCNALPATTARHGSGAALSRCRFCAHRSASLSRHRRPGCTDHRVGSCPHRSSRARLAAQT
jgi:uncharacterized iron-regulated protein